MNWTCRHCEHWQAGVMSLLQERHVECALNRKVFPLGGPGACRDFSREPGSDDEMGADA
jgi:hypothetical protein